MGRKPTIQNYKKYVDVDEESNITTCLLCNSVLKGTRATNAKRHYAGVHNIDIDNENDVQLPSPTNFRVKKYRPRIKITMSKNEFLLCCVGLVTVQNIPFRIFDDEEHFKQILRPYEDLYGTNINSSNIVSKVAMAAMKIKEHISKLVRNRMICLKIDVAARKETRVLVINIQYIENCVIHIYTIGMTQLKDKHTAEFLKNEILSCLKEYDIEISQIYACILDNEVNMIKMPKLLQDLEEVKEEEEEKGTIAEEFESLSSDEDDLEDIHVSLSAIMPVVECAAHTIQLAAQDVLKTIQLEVAECRRLVRSLQAYFQYENLTNFQVPIIDSLTDWNSTFKMIKSLENSKENIERIYDINAPHTLWSFVEKFLKAFQPLSECINKFKFEQYIVGDFYRDWLCCEIELEELSSQKNIYAKNLLKVMRKLKHKLLSNVAFISALYVDPRFNFSTTPFLSEVHKKKALDHLLKTHLTLRRLAAQSTHVPSTPIVDSSPSLTTTGQFSKLESKIKLLIQQTQPPDQSMKIKLESLCNVEKITFETNILDYFRMDKMVDPEFANIFDVALSIPSTQVSVERAFTVLSVILEKTRLQLSNDTLNNFLLVKLNKNLLDNINIVEDNTDEI